MRNRTFAARLALLAVLALALGFVTAGGIRTADAAGPDHKVTICHATASETNPFTSNDIPKHQLFDADGHGHHAGDIIPPFVAGKQGSHTWEDFPGSNWAEEYGDSGYTGEEIWAMGCTVPPATSSTETPTSSTEAPTSSTEGPTSSTEGPTSSTEAPTSSTEGPTSSTEGPTTTAVEVAGIVEEPPAEVLSETAEEGSLPRTGAGTGTAILVFAGLTALGLGLGMNEFARRRRLG